MRIVVAVLVCVVLVGTAAAGEPTLGEVFEETAAADDLHAAGLRYAEQDAESRFRYRVLQQVARLGARGRALARPHLDPSVPRAMCVAMATALGAVHDAVSYEPILALLDELEPGAAGALKNDEARKAWSAVLRALSSADSRRAHRECPTRSRNGPEALKDAYAQAVSLLRMRDPKLGEDLPVPAAD